MLYLMPHQRGSCCLSGGGAPQVLMRNVNEPDIEKGHLKVVRGLCCSALSSRRQVTVSCRNEMEAEVCSLPCCFCLCPAGPGGCHVPSASQGQLAGTGAAPKDLSWESAGSREDKCMRGAALAGGVALPEASLMGRAAALSACGPLGLL